MAIEHIQFLHCDACGARFRDHGQGRVGSRMLCDGCRAKEERSAGGPSASSGAGVDLVADVERTLAELESVATRESFAAQPDEGIGMVDPPAGDGGAGAFVKEIAGRLGSASRPPRQLRSNQRDWEHNARHNRNDGPPEKSTLRRLRWPIPAALALSLVTVSALTVWRLRARGQGLKAGPVVQFLPPGSATAPVPGLPPYEVARELALRFISEGNPEVVVTMIRQWPGCRQEVAAFLAENPPVEEADRMLSDLPPVIRPDVVYQSFGLVLPSGTGRLIQIIETGDGPKVDFKAFSEWCSVSHEALLGGEVKHAGEVRAILRSSSYFNYEFSDSERFLAFSATLAGEHEKLIIYVPRDSSEADQLTRAVSRIGMHPATFSLQAVGESHTRRQFLLSRLLAIGFVVPEPEGDSSSG